MKLSKNQKFRTLYFAICAVLAFIGYSLIDKWITPATQSEETLFAVARISLLLLALVCLFGLFVRVVQWFFGQRDNNKNHKE